MHEIKNEILEARNELQAKLVQLTNLCKISSIYLNIEPAIEALANCLLPIQFAELSTTVDNKTVFKHKNVIAIVVNQYKDYIENISTNEVPRKIKYCVFFPEDNTAKYYFSLLEIPYNNESKKLISEDLSKLGKLVFTFEGDFFETKKLVICQ